MPKDNGGTEMDEEILQDFLVEAGEILDELGEQLITLEGHPEDFDLLNAIFRGFHTIKGGAGFLNLTPLVSISHKSEDVFDLLRSGNRTVDAGLMDVILNALDVLNGQFDALRAGEQPEEAPADLIAKLEALIRGEVVEAEGRAQISAAPSPDATSAADGPPAPPDGAEVELIDEDEYAALVATADKTGPDTDAAAEAAAAAEAGSAASAGGRNLITESEFEDLLDRLHGPGQFGAGAGVASGSTESDGDSNTGASGNDADEAAGGEADHITEAEFDALLDELHGPGQFAADAVGAAGAAGAEVDGDEADAGAADEADLITEQEFDALLDELHGPGRFAPGSKPEAAAETPAEAGTPAEINKSAEAMAPAQATPPRAPEPGNVTALAAAAPEPIKDVKSRQSQPAQETTVRVDTVTLDRMMNMVGELVLIRNRLSNLQDQIANEDVSRTVANLDLVTSNLQNVAMQTRMQPIKKVFGRFPRVVRDLARSLGKNVRLEMSGEDTDLDKNLVEALSDPLVHLVRNSVDHGIETPDVREAAGKPREGALQLSAEQEGDHILLTIRDDGKGIDAEALRRKVIAEGTMDAESAARLSERECFEIIFMPGLSTKEEISDVSGRGVGMDVVKTRINQLNGSIEIDSELGVGTTISITLPLTLAIVPTLMVSLATQPFALPLVNVKEIIDYDPKDVHSVDGQRAIRVRGRVVPLYYLSQWLVDGIHEFESETGHVVIVKIGSQSVALLVDGLIGQEEVVIKPLGRFLQNTTRGLAGATITGNGRIALILDLPELLQVHGQRGAA